MVNITPDVLSNQSSGESIQFIWVRVRPSLGLGLGLGLGVRFRVIGLGPRLGLGLVRFPVRFGSPPSSRRNTRTSHSKYLCPKFDLDRSDNWINSTQHLEFATKITLNTGLRRRVSSAI